MGERLPGYADCGVSVVVPTFREAVNIVPLVRHVQAALASEGVDWEPIFVDDDSRDGSEAIVAELAGGAPVYMEVRRNPLRVPAPLDRARRLTNAAPLTTMTLP